MFSFFEINFDKIKEDLWRQNQNDQELIHATLFKNSTNLDELVLRQVICDRFAMARSLVRWKGRMTSEHYFNVIFLNPYLRLEQFIKELHSLNLNKVSPSYASIQKKILNASNSNMDEVAWKVSDYIEYMFVSTKQLDSSIKIGINSYFKDFIEVLKQFSCDTYLPFLKGTGQIVIEYSLAHLFSCANANKFKLPSSSSEVFLPLPKSDKQIPFYSNPKGKSLTLPSLSLEDNDERIIETLLNIDTCLANQKDLYDALSFANVKGEAFNLGFFLVFFLILLRSQISRSAEKKICLSKIASPLFELYVFFTKKFPQLVLSCDNYIRLHHLYWKFLPKFGERYKLEVWTPSRDTKELEISLLTTQLENFGTLVGKLLAQDNNISQDPNIHLKVIKQETHNDNIVFHVSIDASDSSLFKKQEEDHEISDAKVKKKMQDLFTQYIQHIKNWGDYCGVNIEFKEVNLSYTDASLRAAAILSKEMEIFHLNGARLPLSIGSLEMYTNLKELTIDAAPVATFKQYYESLIPLLKQPDSILSSKNPQNTNKEQARKLLQEKLKGESLEPCFSLKKLSILNVSVEKHILFWDFLKLLFPNLESLEVSVKPNEKIIGLTDAIKLSSMVDGKLLPCGHVFGSEAIASVKTCPIDRIPFTSGTLINFNPIHMLYYKKDAKWYPSLLETSGKQITDESSCSFYHTTCGEIIGQHTLSTTYKIDTAIDASKTKEVLSKSICVTCGEDFNDKTLKKIFISGIIGSDSAQEGFDSFTKIGVYYNV